MKIRIIGPCGSGKTYIANKLSQKYNIPYFELDNIVWKLDRKDEKNIIEIRDSKLKELISMKSWIIEGAQTKEKIKSTELYLKKRYIVRSGKEVFSYIEKIKEMNTIA